MDSASDLGARVARLVEEEQLISPGEGVVVAVSGGPDSVGLLHLLFVLSERWSWKLTVAHVNHGFRGEESVREAEMVEQLTKRLGLVFEGTHIDVPGYIEETGMNAQVAARELRYGFLLEVAERRGATRIALAHHADDQAETVLMRILRGTSPSGLAGIPLRRMEKKGVELIRPLLRINKSEIVAYCVQHELPFCTDSSNLENKYFRNKVRNEVLPYLSRYNEQLPASLGRLADLAGAENDFLDQEARAILERHVRSDDGIFIWSAKWFAGVHVALQRRLIKLILNYLASDPDGIDFHKVEEVRTALLLADKNTRWEIGQNIRLSREYDRITVHTMVLPPLPYRHSLDQNQQQLEIPETGAWLDIRVADGMLDERLKREPYDPYAARFDADELVFPLTVRSRQAGDRFAPFGLNGTKKVKDMFIDAKIPSARRERIPIVADATGRILWLPGIRRSSHALCTDHTVRSIHMRLHMPENPFLRV
ncbi:tRNA lysidine(34) synthetase TilS [Paenibacillus cremeus]|uniref:tRNA(Ile)-lysidine synthase n=1 Tax=Paenibacillus cremeus TaxID=2163881 RepID=A0A559K3U8_9BACL|nr:tRNA lysidine(34) synthetase TilS [Paenibacillus cremeus]TVY06786.1 tRNA lysidine(34) synthetase TilS [Paenibacillus cremeus]